MSALDRLPPAARALLDELTLAPGAGRPVVFDADGTLWRGDVGEDLLRYLGTSALLPTAGAGAYARYEEHLAHSPAAAYAYAVEVMAGLEEARLEAICADFFTRRFLGRVFPFVKPLKERLLAAGYALWLCSASPRWIVQAGARALGFDPACVIAVDCAVDGGVLSRPVTQPVPCGPGKVAWLERRGLSPELAVGNGDLDLDMLAFARRALVVAPPDADNGLVREARGRGWPVIRA